MSIISLALESVRWSLQGKFPQLLHPTAPGMPTWTRVFYVIQIIFFLAASGAASGHIINATKTRSWKNLNLFGLALYLAWWLEIAWAGGYIRGLAP